jgi:hypothetical protein
LRTDRRRAEIVDQSTRPVVYLPVGPAADITCERPEGRHAGPAGGTGMTHEESADTVERALDCCDYLGALLVGDDEILSRLLAALEIQPQASETGGYLVL